MKRWERQLVTDPVYREVLVEYTCDRCGVAEKETALGLIPVAIEVNYGEEYGRRDEYDYCNDCLVAFVAPLLVAAGSKSELVTGSEPD